MNRIIKRTTCYAQALVLVFLMACGGGTTLRVILASSGPLVQSLPLPDHIKNGLVADFTDLGSGAAVMADEIKLCGASKSCKLDSVLKFETLFEKVDARGHFGVHPRIQTVEGIIKGLIGSLKIFYGGTSNRPDVMASPVTEDSINARLKALEKAMKP